MISKIFGNFLKFNKKLSPSFLQQFDSNFQEKYFFIVRTFRPKRIHEEGHNKNRPKLKKKNLFIYYKTTFFIKKITF